MNYYLKIGEGNEINEVTKKFLLEEIKRMKSEGVQGVKVRIIGIDTNMKNEVLYSLGEFITPDGSAIIFDDELRERYTKNIASVCSRRCNKNKKNTCPGCQEYLAINRILLNTLDEVEIYYETDDVKLVS